MAGGYRAVAARPGARRLLAAIGLAWLGFGMELLAVFLTVQRATASTVTAGFAVAAFSVGAAALAPVRGRVLDRRGTRPWLAIFACASGAALVAPAFAARAGADATVLVGLSVLGGLAAPPLVASLRLRWADVLPDAELRRGYALTSLIGDAGMVVGPALAGLLFTVAAWLPLALCGAAVACAGLMAGASPPRADDGGPPARLAGPAMTTLVVVSVALGLAMGMVEVAVPAGALHWDVAGWAGVMLGALAAGSIAGGLWFGRRSWTGRPLRRYVLAAGTLGVLIVPLAAATGPAVLGGLLVLTGLAYGPATIALFEALDLVAPGRGTEAFTWITTAEAAGASAGAAAAGWLAAHPGLPWAFIPAAAILVAAAVWGLPRTAR
ncbi:MAG: MFS transporter [Thermoleophilia bacterium]|nr:MFS transporter [Thermoleophilia bacterium]